MSEGKGKAFVEIEEISVSSYIGTSDNTCEFIHKFLQEHWVALTLELFRCKTRIARRSSRQEQVP